MYSYKAYGLGIHSQFKLFNFPVIESEPDVILEMGVIDTGPVGVNSQSAYHKLTDREVVFHINGVGSFRVADGKQIIVDPQAQSDDRLVQRFILGACIALLLYQRGQLVIHASAVKLFDRGVVFVGASGAGKSSIASAFLVQGHEFLVDDISCVRIKHDIPWIYQGFPYIKLDNSTPALEELRKGKLNFVDYLEDKAGFQTVYNPTIEKTELKCIFVIKPGEVIEIQQYDFQRSLIELVRYSIPPSLVKLDKASHFKRCLEVVNRVPVYELRRPASLSCLPELVSKIEKHVAKLA